MSSRTIAHKLMLTGLPVVAVVSLLQPVVSSAATPAAAPPATRADDPAKRPDSLKLSNLADNYFQRWMELFPVTATEVTGDPRVEGKLEIDIAPEHRQRQARLYHDVRRELAGIRRDRLTSSEKITFDLLRHESDTRLILLKHPTHLMPLQHMSPLPLQLADWAGGAGAQSLKTVANYENFLQRLERLPLWARQVEINLRAGEKQGLVQHRAIIERTLPQLKSLAGGKIDAHPYYRPIRNLPQGFSEADKDRLARSYVAAIEQRIAPAMARLVRYLENEHLARTRNTAGWGALPGGAAWYADLVRASTTTTLSPEEIHALGLKEVARIRGEMDKVRQQVKHEGDLNSFLAGLVNRPELTPFKTEDEVLARFRAIDARVRPGLSRLFSRMPKAAFEIRGVDPLIKDSVSSNYVLPAEDGSRPGVFFAVINEPEKFLLSSMTALLLHEGQPGHHFQGALQQELNVPRFRRSMWFDAMGEGWGLYAESLGTELGVYDDPWSWLGRLQLELHRAIRLVVDTGLHAKGWTREDTIRYIMETEGSQEPNARRATERYMAWPAQALSYKVGELRILALREKARTALGGRFDIKAFHELVLGEGMMPLSMLEARVDAWITKQGAQAAADPANIRHAGG